MRMKLFLAAAAVARSRGVVAATAGAAGGGIAYSFLGKLSAAPSGGHVSITVEGGNRPALRAMLGHVRRPDVLLRRHRPSFSSGRTASRRSSRPAT